MTANGKVATSVDLGAGYKYAVLLEDAKVRKQVTAAALSSSGARDAPLTESFYRSSVIKYGA